MTPPEIMKILRIAPSSGQYKEIIYKSQIGLN